MQAQSSFLATLDETWRPVVDYEDRYEVSDHGRVRSLLVARGGSRVVLRPSVRRGYLVVQLWRDNTVVGRSVHRLVIEAFVGPCPAGHECAHLNGRRADDRLANLRWVTPSENQAHRVLHGTDSSGDRNPSRARPDRLARGDQNGARLHPERLARGSAQGAAKLTETAILEIRRARQNGELRRVIAARYGIDESSVGLIARRKTWRHVPDD